MIHASDICTTLKMTKDVVSNRPRLTRVTNTETYCNKDVTNYDTERAKPSVDIFQNYNHTDIPESTTAIQGAGSNPETVTTESNQKRDDSKTTIADATTESRIASGHFEAQRKHNKRKGSLLVLLQETPPDRLRDGLWALP